MRLLLINPDNPVVGSTKVTRGNRLNRFRIWKPLGLLTLARLTPSDWDVEVVDENSGPYDYEAAPRPDLVGITAFTSQATRAYRLADAFRARQIPVVMGGIHVSMCVQEGLQHADAVVTGEAEEQWPRVLADLKAGRLRRLYEGGLVPTEAIPAARHDLLAGQYHFGSIQTTRGCPLRCTFCSVTAFNGGKFRHRPIAGVVEELRQIRESWVLFVDDNLIGTRQDHLAYSKELLRAIVRSGIRKRWICQATINFADDDELLALAYRAGARGVYIGFESPTVEGLIEIHKKFNIQKGRDMRASVRRIQRHGILVIGSFIMGLDSDRPGVAEVIARAARQYGVDAANLLILTPLPGTELYRKMESERRLRATNHPEDWQYYTLSQPVAEYKHFSWEELVRETGRFNDLFYPFHRIAARTLRMLPGSWRDPAALLGGVISNLTYRKNHFHDRRIHEARAAQGSEIAMGAGAIAPGTPSQ
jgi:radical SAM superfamily enzyme YgiQ (UPF0313 family)